MHSSGYREVCVSHLEFIEENGEGGLVPGASIAKVYTTRTSQIGMVEASLTTRVIILRRASFLHERLRFGGLKTSMN